ncbi:MAG: DEAD/DEAH box helicase [Eubacteriales bacterium]
MKLTIDSVLRLQGVPGDVLKQIKSELTFKNPTYTKMKYMRKPRWMWGQEYIKLWSEKDVNGAIEYILPRGYFPRLWNLAGLSWGKVNDQRVRLPEVVFPVKPNLRDYQVPAVGLAKDWQQGIVNSPAGSGKTVIGHAIIADLKQPALWLTHRTDLLQQSMERARTFLGLDDSQMGVIQEDRCSIGSHITFASVQTLMRRDLSEIRNRFGCLVVDEVHRCFDDKFSKEDDRRMFDSVISQIPAFYRFGLTATVGRSDGLIQTMLHIMGPVFYEIKKDDPRLLTLKPSVEFIGTQFEFHMPTHTEKDEETGEEEEKEDSLSIQSMYAAMRQDEARNAILFDVLREKIVGGDACVCLGHHLAHLEILHDYVTRVLGRSSVFINGSTDMSKREAIFNDVRKGKYQYIFATYGLVKEGLDIARLNKLVLTTPVKDRVTVEQALGRIQRPEEGKSIPVVYDFYDNKVKACQKWARERAKVYGALGCQVEGGPKVRKK